jgi:hypothetical protein
MASPFILYVAAALMAIVAVACTALCLAWSIPSWRCRLARQNDSPKVAGAAAVGLRGWPARVGSGLVSAGIAVCAVVAWYGCYTVLTTLSVAA